jgi:primosomal protein N' (replication factor Y)
MRQFFSYLVPENLIQDIRLGQEVLVPFCGKKIVAVILEVVKNSNSLGGIKLKSIIKIIDTNPSLSSIQLKLACWISDYYYTSLGLVLKLMLPKRVNIKKFKSQKLNCIKTSFPKLTSTQDKIFKLIISSSSSISLLRGVTGSGKTEIYFRVIKEILSQGKQVIFLVPEISLTPQTVQRFAGRFDPKIVALLHSGLSASEKFKAWQEIRDQKIKIIIGPRSAIFAPVGNLGLVIIDEEHDPSYKQYDQNPRYHARNAAIKLCELNNAKIILGSATPSIESYYFAKRGLYKLQVLGERFTGNKVLPKIEIVDMREEFKKKNFSIFSEKLRNELRRVIQNKKQAILFINRRGTSTFVMCRDCGYVFKCPSCEVPLIFHSKGFEFQQNQLVCHHCNHRETMALLCPKCKSQYIKHFGVGTERVESELKKLFSDIKTVRMDSDTVNTKFAHFRIYNDFLDKKFDILIGTQMITKGLDLPNVEFVGIVSPDTILNLPDFKSSETVFQLITQVAGRVGRGKNPGKVILQTYNPENVIIKIASLQDFPVFYNHELKEREGLNYPPLSSLIKLIYQDKNLNRAKEESDKLAKKLGRYIKVNKLPVTLLGPAPSFISKKRNRYFWQLILKIDRELKLEIRNKLLNLVPGDFLCDIDPENLL